MTPELFFTQAGGAGASAPGFSLLATFAQMAHSVVAANGDNTNVVEWTFDMTDVPPGSAVPSGIVQDGNVPTYTFLPDKPGGYRLTITLKDNAGNLAQDTRVFQVAEPSGRIVPPFSAKGSELNFTLPGAGSANTRGWAALQELYDRQVDATQGSATSAMADANYTELLGVYSLLHARYAQALTADRTVTFPTPASAVGDYIRVVENATSGGHNVVVKCGAGATVSVAPATIEILLFKSTGDVVVVGGGGSSGITQLTGSVLAGPGSGSQAATVVNVDGTAGVALINCQDLVFLSSVTGPLFGQSGPNGAGDGQNLGVQAQAGNVAANGNGGTLNLAGGAKGGTGLVGGVSFYAGGLAGTQVGLLAQSGSDFIAFGAIPSTSDFLRLPSGAFISARDSTNSVNVSLIGLDGSNNVVIANTQAASIKSVKNVRFQVAGMTGYTDSYQAELQTTDGAALTVATYAIPSNTSVKRRASFTATKSDFSLGTGGDAIIAVRNNGGAIATDLAVFSSNTYGAGAGTILVSGTNLIDQVTGVAATTYNWHDESTSEVR